MSVSAALRRELLALSPEERHELADELYESVVDEKVDPEWEAAWSKEIAQRVRDVEENRVELVDADEVHRGLCAEFGSKPR